MANQVRSQADPRLMYLDLFCGPGRYDDGRGNTVASTAISILEYAVGNADLREMLITLFNDAKEEHIAALKKNILAVPGIDGLKHRPRVRTGEVDESVTKVFAGKKIVPTFSFIDPFGFKGLTLELIDSLLRNFGCDMVLFFNFNQINRFLTTKAVKKHIDGLFGEARADELREACKQVQSQQREELVIEKYIEALNDLGYDYVIPYVVEFDEKDRTSHYLIFISKNHVGFKVMKGVMYALSENKTQGVAKFGYVGSVNKTKTPILDFFNTPLDDMANHICEVFAGRSLTRKQLMTSYDKNYPKNPYVDQNWRDALTMLETEGRIEADPPMADRPKRKGVATFGENTTVTFADEED